jgi:hypothetical protein
MATMMMYDLDESKVRWERRREVSDDIHKPSEGGSELYTMESELHQDIPIT